MKKNAMLKIAAILMVAVLLTTCAISSTFAKYVSAPAAVTATQARVAKWGITVTAEKADGKELFLNSYDDTVLGSASALVVAPGTKNETSAFNVSIESDGTPEVDYQIVVESNFDVKNWTTTGSDFYCPLVIKIGTATPVSGLDFTAEADFEAAVNKAFASAILGAETSPNGDGDFVKKYEAGNAPTNVAATATAITWSWAFEGDNAKDTKLGDATTAATIDFTFSVAAEQID